MTKKLNNNFTPEPLLTTGDIARYCTTGVPQVNRWIKKGDLIAFRNPGGQYRITKKEFRKFLERNGMPIVEEFFQEVKNKKILIADDDSTLVDSFSELIKAYFKDVEIEVAYDGYETLIKTGDFKPDLLILDIRMPKIDGLEVCRRIRQNNTIYPDIKILAMTGHSEAYERDEVLDSGANEYLIKSFDIDNLIEHVKKLL
ncbi:response regulator [Candidatus Latescibacterota bacterium]